MTVGTKVKQTTASLRGAHATLAMYAQLLQQAEDQQTFTEAAEQVEQVCHQLEKRIRQLEFKEPQYKGI